MAFAECHSRDQRERRGAKKEAGVAETCVVKLPANREVGIWQMVDDLELRKAQVHSSMPASYVEFVRRLWLAQEKESQYTWSHEAVIATRPLFLKLLASARLAAELCRVYETPVGPRIAEALAGQAVHLPGLWESEDKRTKEEKAAWYKRLRRTIKALSALLGQDRSVPDDYETTRRLPPLAFENVFSEPLLARSWNGWVGRQVPNLEGVRLRLSLYQLDAILRAFDKPLAKGIETINKFRTHAVDDPVLMHMGQITKGTPWIRHAALILDQSIDQFAADFTQFKRKVSRDRLVSAFVMAIYPNTMEEVASSQAINRICGSRRKSITRSVG
jgi:hypothetical protein